MMAKVDYFAELALEKYDHASSDLGCWNCHYVLFKSFLISFWSRLLIGTYRGLVNDVV